MAAVVHEVDSRESRKRADFLEVERRLLKTARRLIRERGFQELTMGRLADASGCRRRTVYNHFANTEDVVMALSIQSTARRADLVARAATFEARHRERFNGIAAVLIAVLPYHMRHEACLFTIRVENTSPQRQMALRSHEERLISTIAGVVRDGMTAGDLELPMAVTPESLALDYYHTILGAHAVAQRGFGFGSVSIGDSLQRHVRQGQLILDDLGWRPLSSEFDYTASGRRVWLEVFPDLLAKFNVQL
jgi:AcrR family transcriptional regulator